MPMAACFSDYSGGFQHDHGAEHVLGGMAGSYYQ